jgi:pimeloyl-ACP methyl ester carboxylesterase
MRSEQTPIGSGFGPATTAQEALGDRDLTGTLAIIDGTCAKLPVLGLGGPGYAWLKATLSGKTTDLRVIKVKGSGHFIAEEQPDFTVHHRVSAVAVIEATDRGLNAPVF